MKTFETPYVDVKKFDIEDVLTTSGVTPSSEPSSEPTTEEEENFTFPGTNCF